MKTMHGLPVREDAPGRMQIVIMPEDVEGAERGDAEGCAIALGCRRQIHAPYVHIMRSRAYLAQPHPEGGEVEGFRGTWAMFRYFLTQGARDLVVAVDTGTITEDDYPLVIDLVPIPEHEKFANKNSGQTEQRAAKRAEDEPPAPNRGVPHRDVLALLGVRNYSNRSPQDAIDKQRRRDTAGRTAKDGG